MTEFMTLEYRLNDQSTSIAYDTPTTTGHVLQIRKLS